VRDIDEQFSAWQIELEELSAVGNEVILIGKLSGRGRVSAIELDQPFANVLTFTSDHRITRIRIYWDLDEARKAVRMAE
jgi:hypothetical protein